MLDNLYLTWKHCVTVSRPICVHATAPAIPGLLFGCWGAIWGPPRAIWLASGNMPFPVLGPGMTGMRGPVGMTPEKPDPGMAWFVLVMRGTFGSSGGCALITSRPAMAENNSSYNKQL